MMKFQQCPNWQHSQMKISMWLELCNIVSFLIAGFSPEIFEGVVAFSGVVKLGRVSQSATQLQSLTSTFIYMINFALIKKILFSLLLKKISGTLFLMSISKPISIKMKNPESPRYYMFATNFFFSHFYK